MNRIAAHPAIAVVAAVAMALALGIMLATGLTWNVRWTVYLLIAPFVLLALLWVSNRAALLGALFVPLILFETVLISIIRLGPINVGVSLPILALVSVSMIRQGAAPRSISSVLPAWIVLLLAASSTAAAARTDVAEQFRAVQLYYAEGLLYFLLGAMAWRNSNDIRQFGWAMIGIALVMSLLQGRYLMTGSAELARPADTANIGLEWRYGGPLGNSNSFADFFAMIIPATILLAATEVHKRWRIAAAVAGAVFASSILLTGSRGGGLAALTAAALAVSTLVIGRRRGALLLPLLALSLVASAILADRIFPDVYEQSLDRWRERGLEDVRTEVWRITLDIIADNPLGIGHDPFDFTHELATRGPTHYFAGPHNIYLGLAVSTGILGFLAWSTIVGWALVRGVRSMLAAETAFERTTRAIPLLAVVTFLVAGFTEPIYDNGHKLNHVFWLWTGALMWNPLRLRPKTSASAVPPPEAAAP